MRWRLPEVGLFALSCFLIIALPAHTRLAPVQEAFSRLREESALFLSSHDVEVQVGGQVRYDTFNFTSPLVLRYDYFDRYTFQRARLSLDVDTAFGCRQFGEPAITTHMRLTSFNVVDNNHAYTPVLFEPVAFNAKNYIKKAEIGDHQHDLSVVQTFLEDAFLEVRLEKFVPLVVPSSLKVGYFGYNAGRGVALGHYYGGAVDMLGWFEEGNIGNNTQRSPGLVLTLGESASAAVELYYSKWKCRSQGPDYTRKELRARRLDRDDLLEDPRSIQRGHSADRDLFCVKGIFKHAASADSFASHVEPYAVCVNAPELKVEFEGDASARIFTVGCMADWAYNGWRLNAEAAVQFGHQTMHPIDRNHPVSDDMYYTETATAFVADGDGVLKPDGSAISGNLQATIGHPAKYHSHVFMGISLTPEQLNSGQYLPYRAYYVSDELEHVNAQRSTTEQGALVRTGAPLKKTDSLQAGAIYQSKKFEVDPSDYANSSLYSPYQFKSGIDFYDTTFAVTGKKPHGTLFNANIPFGGATRFRPKYTLDMAGFMAMLDVSYTLPTKRATLSCAVAHVSGDDDPCNTEVDKRYQGFVPLRDAHYQGQHVKSYALLAARRVARPSTFSDRLLYAQNNYEETTNLQYIGFGCVMRPCADRKELLIEANLLHFWESKPPFAWDKHARRDFGNEQWNGIWAKAQSDLHFTGYQRTERASKQLGLEFNTVVTWNPLPCLEVRVLFATFVPGKLYRDIEGTPNAYAIRLDADGDVHLDSLGHKIPFGGMVRLTYFF